MTQKSTDGTAELTLQIEAALMVSDKPMPATKIAEALGEGVAAKDVTTAIKKLNEAYESTGRSFRVEQVAGGFQILTLPQFGSVLTAIQKTREATRLSPAAMETLAIVAYQQPVLRAHIESIRGVASGEVLRNLMDRKLVKIVGRAEELGRPMLYGTSRKFLELFGLASLKDLPPVEQFKPGAAKPQLAVAPAEEPSAESQEVNEPDAVGSTAAETPDA